MLERERLEASRGIFVKSAVHNASSPFSCQMVSINNHKCNSKPELTVLRMIVTGMSAGSCGEEMYLFKSEFSPRMSCTSLQLLHNSRS